MSNIEELRMLVQDFKLSGSPMLIQTTQMNELLDRLEAAEKERDAAELMSLALRAKVEQMEKQEPVGYMPLATKAALEAGGTGVVWNCRDRCPADEPLYALPGAQAQPTPSLAEGWLRAIDEALVVAHIGVANESDTYEQANAKLNNLIGFHVDVATDPAVNGGWKLVPTEPTTEMICEMERQWMFGSQIDMAKREWKAACATAPGAKP